MPNQCKGQHGPYIDCHCYRFLFVRKKINEAENLQKKEYFLSFDIQHVLVSEQNVVFHLHHSIFYYISLIHIKYIKILIMHSYLLDDPEGLQIYVQ